MKDYAVMLSGLPQLEGSEPVEEELKAGNLWLVSSDVLCQPFSNRIS